LANQLLPFVPGTFRALGTDGFGRSDSRERLRDFFEVDRRFICLAALAALADEDRVERRLVSQAMRDFDIPADKAYPPRS
jgi:pyruvate dehydrogenase E1 component